MKKLESNILSTYKEKGQAWLDALPDFLNNIEKKQSLKIDKPFYNLTINYIAPATMQDGTSVIFKCGVSIKELTSEIAVLKYYDAEGAVRVIDANAEEGWIVLERCVPGKTLKSVNDDYQSIEITVNVLQRLWKPIDRNAPFPTLEDWFETFIPNERLSKEMMDYAKTTSKELLDSQGERVLLHADLHDKNILSSQRDSWLAIDPKGVMGEREFDLVGVLLQTRSPSALSKEIIYRRLEQISELTGFDQQRLMQWAAVKFIFGACWCIEHKIKSVEKFIASAELVYSCLRS